jgi:CheY-like chemotaxis protein
VTEQVNNQHTKSNSLPDISSTRILLVEDEPDIAVLLIFLLESEGAISNTNSKFKNKILQALQSWYSLFILFR